MSKKVNISIILPVYNEGENITRQILVLEKKIEGLFEILVIYDFNEDNTIPYVKKLQQKYKQLHLLKNNFGRGVIPAVRTGIDESLGDAIVIMPADLADDPNTVNKMYDKILQGFDIVSATRYAKGGEKIGGGVIKTVLSRFAGLSTPIILGIPITDISNGFKMYRRKVLDEIKIESTGGWEYSCELVIKAHKLGFKIGEIPTVWKDRTSGKSKFKLLKWLPKYLRWYLYGVFLRFRYPPAGRLV